MDMDLSVVIPVYNAEKTLSDIVDSILACNSQDFELILVNDGSKDASGSVCELYAQKDKRCRVFCQNNQGVSVARNVGIREAKGKYILFCDSDDTVFTDAFGTLLEKIKLYQSDLFVADYVYKDIVTGEAKNSSFCLSANRIMQREEIVQTLISPLVLRSATDLASLWHKVFKRELIVQNGIAFEEKVHKGEDWRFILDFLMKTETAVYFPLCLYEYKLDGTQSITKYRHEPGVHLLGSVKRKLAINRNCNLKATREQVVSWYVCQLNMLLSSLQADMEDRMLDNMIEDWSMQESAMELLKLQKQDYLRMEISRRYYLYSLLIRGKKKRLLKMMVRGFER